MGNLNVSRNKECYQTSLDINTLRLGELLLITEYRRKLVCSGERIIAIMLAVNNDT